MSIWSKLFQRKKEETPFVDNRTTDNQIDDFQKEDYQVEDMQVDNSTPTQNPEKKSNESVMDEYGWRVLSNGVKFKNDPHMEGTLNDIFTKCIDELGYNKGELYVKDNLNTSPFIVGFFQLLTKKLIGIARNDDVKMTISEIEAFTKEHRDLMEYEEEDLLKDGIENHNITQSYLETIIGDKCKANCLSNRKYSFFFDNGILVDFKRIDDYSANARDYLNVNAYYEEAQEWYGGIKERIIEEINLQASCFVCIDLNIIRSSETKMRFSYHNGYPNYIAIAAYYKSKDVLLDEFVNSTHGQYEIIAKEVKGTTTITKAKAYGLIYIFVNGHSNVDLNSSALINEDECRIEQGYVYVMVNPSLPNLVKIGKTTRDPNERAKELSASTGVPTPFIAVFYKPFTNCDMAEKTIHSYLEQKGYRVNDNREFFNISTNEAIGIVQAYYDLEQKNNKTADGEIID